MCAVISKQLKKVPEKHKKYFTCHTAHFLYIKGLQFKKSNRKQEKKILFYKQGAIRGFKKGKFNKKNATISNIKKVPEKYLKHYIKRMM